MPKGFFRSRRGAKKGDGVTRRVGRTLAMARERLQLRAKLHESETYCLACFATMPRSEKRCDLCNFSNLKSMRRRCWNQHPDLLGIQTFLRWAALGLGVLTAFLVFQGSAGWLVEVFGFRGGPRVLTLTLMGLAGFILLLHKTSGKLTMHQPYFRPTIFWMASFCLGALLTGGAMPVLGAFLLAMAVGTFFLGRSLESWKRHKCGLDER